MNLEKIKNVVAVIFIVIGGVGIIPMVLYILYEILFGSDPSGWGGVTGPNYVYDHLDLVMSIGIPSFILLSLGSKLLFGGRPKK
jgi:hypothetical protein